jgi:hypothetical protein
MVAACTSSNIGCRRTRSPHPWRSLDLRSDRCEDLPGETQVIRAAMIAFALAVLIYALIDQPKPVKSVQVDYCMISYRALARDQFGLPHIIWTQGWGPCSLLDRYENI